VEIVVNEKKGEINTCRITLPIRTIKKVNDTRQRVKESKPTAMLPRCINTPCVIPKTKVKNLFVL